jgi:hypothetical protein
MLEYEIITAFCHEDLICVAEFTWEFCDESIVQGIHVRMLRRLNLHDRTLWLFRIPTWAIHSGGVHVTMFWGFRINSWLNDSCWTTESSQQSHVNSNWMPRVALLNRNSILTWTPPEWMAYVELLNHHRILSWTPHACMGHSGGVHVRIMWLVHSAAITIQREFTWEFCDESIVQGIHVRMLRRLNLHDRTLWL